MPNQQSTAARLARGRSGRAARFEIPKALPTEIERRELTGRLDDSQDTRLVALIAPSGYGKTTLLAQWARQSDETIVWVALSENDADPMSFLRCVAEGVSTAQPETVLTEWREVTMRAVAAEQSVTTLLRELNELPVNLTIILDGTEHLSEDSARLFLRLADGLGEGHRMLFADHPASNVNISRLLATGEAETIDVAALAFTLSETRTLLDLLNQPIPPEQLHQDLEGWPIGITFIARTGQAGGSTSLVDTVLDRLQPELRAAMTQLATLGVWSERDALEAGMTLPNGWLEDAQRAGVPLTPLGDGRFRPHQVVCEALDQMLRRDQTTYAQLHQRAAERLQSRGMLYESMQHLIKARAYTSALKVAEELLPRWRRSKDHQMIVKITGMFPDHILTPFLRTARGVGLMETGKRSEGHELLLQVYRSGQAIPWTYLGLAIIAYRTANPDAMLPYLEEGLALAQRTGDQRGYIDLLSVKALAYCALHRGTEAVEVAQEAWRRAEAIGDTLQLLNITTYYGYALELAGRREEAFEVYRTGVNVANIAGLPLMTVGMVQRLTDMHRDRGTAHEALPLIERILPAIRASYPMAEAVMLAARGQIAMATGDLPAAIADAQQAADMNLRNGVISNALSEVLQLSATLALDGRPAEARAQLDRAHRLKLEHNTNVAYHTIHHAHGLVPFYEGDMQAAKEQFSKAIDDPTDWTDAKFYATAFMAEIARQEGTLTEAHADALAKRLLSPQGRMVMTLGAARNTLQELMRTFIRQGWHPEIFEAFLSAPLTTTKARPQLRLTLLGKSSATINGVPVTFAWNGAMKILAYVFTQPDRTAHADSISLDLWPDTELSKRRDRLKTAIRNANGAVQQSHLSRDEAAAPLHSPDGRTQPNKRWMASPLVDIITDVEELRAAAHAHPERLNDLYQGPFLDGETGDWVDTLREELASLTQEGMMRHAAALASRDPFAALHQYRRAAEVYPSDPNVYKYIAAMCRKVGDDVGVLDANNAFERAHAAL
ncbi:AAA family ATPase [Deinococcus soli (ex Cha et al. 2016)]|uniref:Tetratricopeptide (TPR) repeat protein n=2 Tax=Deinococcus soli (ex Cha et al. 2016) TaxID=1309411 RepID=A0ACC6KFM9_9DEIO|nr:AAA family ATPase [Deinococcus soli (ex Cha et al. 2016)]MDR6218342.1 tetratricopeptide (TPR) repeat protein [Deinococcus soli (ex Cha et al. 2016)]MDR6329082.1 tetratricopeptide (TPR) repeat protein [Deinococcus soli (ex Cha et al. 2016)]MDR6751355.1 tetratricopeptide (TPR) repeat protein [Deinococcus soli (ex Cha et al. 2016)]